MNDLISRGGRRMDWSVNNGASNRIRFRGNKWDPEKVVDRAGGQYFDVFLMFFPRKEKFFSCGQ